MKLYISKFILGLMILSVQFISAQNLSKSQFKVKGNCEMCQSRIETAAKKAGAKTAVYSIDLQTLTIETDRDVSTDEILKKVADAGHDNEKFKSTDDTYKALPGCCHYERNLQPSSAEAHQHHTKNGNEFYVKGNCASCKARIEKAAKAAGADSAEWSAEKQTVTLNFDASKTSSDKVLKAIADAGHDNEKYKTSDEVYKNLPGCCLYDRSIPFGEANPNVHFEEGAKHNDHALHQPTVADTHEPSEKKIDGVVITGSKAATALSKKEAGLVFNIDKKELLKAACCNLSESFETNATVDVSFSNAVTGT
ncbi:Copper chaperone CopZ [Chryseobacterium vrystaatense]|uniref:Copper chaperone CopZ n=1 Tax=Chryseobacterium vrystaatense TaxID=307480 RepID=A0A1M4VFH6_9FLAO|nr:Copper chaperone CopZ [Chryseobacterium vrystaatense]